MYNCTAPLKHQLGRCYIKSINLNLNLSTIIIIYTICIHNKLRALVASLAFQQAKEVKADETNEGNYNC